MKLYIITHMHCIIPYHIIIGHNVYTNLYRHMYKI